MAKKPYYKQGEVEPDTRGALAPRKIRISGGRVAFSCYLTPETKAEIVRLAEEAKVSNGTIVDRAIAALGGLSPKAAPSEDVSIETGRQLDAIIALTALARCKDYVGTLRQLIPATYLRTILREAGKLADSVRDDEDGQEGGCVWQSKEIFDLLFGGHDKE